MKLGAFSMSLNVKDLAASRAFYEELGFETAGGDADQGWLILRDGDTLLGLFKDHIPANTLTFNPGWTQGAENLPDGFEDVRAIQARLKKAGLKLDVECDPDGSGPAHIALLDPDGNAILIDQHR
ncbi:MAG: VOC family protein [Pseudomonadota bacterium]